jgi:hypothetical protein
MAVKPGSGERKTPALQVKICKRLAVPGDSCRKKAQNTIQLVGSHGFIQAYIALA